MENNNQISAEEYCEICKEYLKKLASLEEKKMEELELNSEKYGDNAIEVYTSQKSSDEIDSIEMKLRALFAQEYAELEQTCEKMLSYLNRITAEEVKES